MSRLARLTPDTARGAAETYALKVYREPTAITDDQIDTLRQHGYTDPEIADVVGLEP